MNMIRCLWERLVPKVPSDVGVGKEVRDREIVMRLARGNVRLQLGMYVTEEELAQERAKVLKHKFN